MRYALSINKLCKTYVGGVVALKNINLDVERGDFFALLGPNGAGKSTTINVISSLAIKDSGKVEIMGLDIDQEFNRARKRIGIVGQEFNFNNFERVYDIVVTQAGYYGVGRSTAKERANKYLKLLGLWDKRTTRAIELSGGMKRRLMIARALLHEPDVLILDEPTAGVDVELRHSMWDFLRELNKQGVTIILTTHYLEEAEYLCQNVAVINSGEIVYDGSMNQVLNMLSQQEFVLDIKNSTKKLPAIKEIDFQTLSDSSIQISVPADMPLNHIFGKLDENNIEVMSIRPKTNRLEQMFLALTSKNT